MFIDLAPVRDARLVAATIARALELREVGGSAQQLVLRHLRHRQALLLLDNFEHLLAAGPLLAELLANCAALRLLVTNPASSCCSGGWRCSPAAGRSRPPRRCAAIAGCQPMTCLIGSRC